MATDATYGGAWGVSTFRGDGGGGVSDTQMPAAVGSAAGSAAHTPRRFALQHTTVHHHGDEQHAARRAADTGARHAAMWGSADSRHTCGSCALWSSEAPRRCSRQKTLASVISASSAAWR
jgi:hypothetical protein